VLEEEVGGAQATGHPPLTPPLHEIGEEHGGKNMAHGRERSIGYSGAESESQHPKAPFGQADHLIHHHPGMSLHLKHGVDLWRRGVTLMYSLSILHPE
jgi:hypothetical protein